MCQKKKMPTILWVLIELISILSDLLVAKYLNEWFGFPFKPMAIGLIIIGYYHFMIGLIVGKY